MPKNIQDLVYELGVSEIMIYSICLSSAIGYGIFMFLRS